ncbi:cupin-like protein, putative [Plasmodium gallinaceum]|uniref:Cupin-like protein, putative n=1 Tax=Plasmodium gallinaceum TaxID=5849 RepID=A0A1J1GVJ7_PLAGA|nr:cupin-like protein, putative [Plasmodium gallinaceum]CRG96270.1 cupin-like protein, putative [Plasmodium gallinaceum]
MALKNEYSGFCFHKQKLNKIDRIDKNISAEQFYLDYVLKRKPCLLKSEYIIGERCNIDINFMKENVENSYVELEQKVSNSFGIGKKKKMKFHKFLSLIEKGDSNYYLNTQYIKENPYGPTDFCNSITRQMINFLPKKLKIMGNLEIYQYNIWLGNNEDKNLKTFLHHDYHDNIYVLLKGKKIFRIYSPNFAYDLKTNGNINRIYNNGLITYSPFIRSDGSHYFDVYKKKIDKVYSDINTMNEHLNKENNLIEDKIIEKCINKAEKKLNKLENNILDYKLRKSKFQYKEKKRNDIPNHFCILNTTERKYELDIFNDNTDIKQKYIEVCMNEEDILYLPCGWFHEVKSFSGEKYHLAFNYWYYPPYIKMNSSGEAQNRFCHPYVDKYLSERNKNLYKKIGIFIKENVPNIKDILSYYINYDTKKCKKIKRKKIKRFSQKKRIKNI